MRAKMLISRAFEVVVLARWFAEQLSRFRLLQPLPHWSRRTGWIRRAAIPALVVMLAGLVHCLAGSDGVHAADDVTGNATVEASRTNKITATAESDVGRPVQVDLDELPIPVLEMRDAILVAVESGDLEDLRTAIEWNELRPEFGVSKDDDPIEVWGKQSEDGKGSEILELLGKLLEDGPASLPIGRDHENNAVYVWPYLSEVPVKNLNAADREVLSAMMSEAELGDLLKHGKWTWYRLAIGADGTWHVFSKAAQ